MNRLLQAVGLLGGDTPACGDLKDIIDLYSEFQPYKADSEIQNYEFDFEDSQIREEDYKNKNITLEKVRKLIIQLTMERDEIWDKRRNIAEKSRAESDMKAREISIKIQALEEEMKEIIKKEGKYDIEEVKKMEVKELEAKVEKLQQENDGLKKEFEKKDEELKESEKKKDEAETKVKEGEQEKTKTETNAIVDKLISEKHLLPADKEAIVEMICASENEEQVKKYKIGDKEKSLKEILVETFGKYTVDLNTDEKSETGETGSKEDNQALRDKAEKYAKEHGVDYRTALREVSK